MSAGEASTSRIEAGADRYIRDINERRLTGRVLSLKYRFDMTRCKFLTDCKDVKENCNGIIYYMQRDFRIYDNWALLYAQTLALKTNSFVHIVFPVKQDILYPTRRQFNFLMEGLREVAAEAKRHGMKFYILNDSAVKLASLVNENNIGALVTDFSPLREYRYCREILDAQFPADVPLIQVDTHNIVPVWEASDHQESSSKTFRPKVTKLLYRYLNRFPIPYTFMNSPKLVDNDVEMRVGVPKDIESTFKPTAETVQEMPPILWARPGPTASFRVLYRFIKESLTDYAGDFNNPSADCVSRLSPYLHFGFIASQRIALELHRYKPRYHESIEKYLDHLIVKKELSDNYCYYNTNYDNLFGVRGCVAISLVEHCLDQRRCTYKPEQFEQADTHDPLWNAAQLQLIREGLIHNYMRMYWGKKILEWTNTPDIAHKIALHLNNVYSLDGNDPLSFTGVLWCIGGVHDIGYSERSVYGKVRYMVGSSLVHRFKMGPYLRKYGCWKEGIVVNGIYTPDTESLPRIIKKKKKQPKKDNRRKRRKVTKQN